MEARFMVKVNAPALSLDASGSIAGTLVFSKWKGRNYVRELVKPANPRSGGQVGMRAAMKFLAQQWAGLLDAEKATWEDRAANLVASEFNAFVSYNLFRARNFLAPSKEDPAGAAGTIATLSGASATAGVRSITYEDTVTVVNDNWAVAIYRSTAPGFSTAYDNLIAIVEASSAASFAYVDSPLAPGKYYYNSRCITEDGLLGAEEGEVNATVV